MGEYRALVLPSGRARGWLTVLVLGPMLILGIAAYGRQYIQHVETSLGLPALALHLLLQKHAHVLIRLQNWDNGSH